MLALRGRNAAILPSLSANCTSDGLGTRSARAHRANARAGPINPSADLAGRATRLGLEVIAKNSRQDFDQPGCQDGLRLTLTHVSLKFPVIQLIGHAIPFLWHQRRAPGRSGENESSFIRSTEFGKGSGGAGEIRTPDTWFRKLMPQ